MTHTHTQFWWFPIQANFTIRVKCEKNLINNRSKIYTFIWVHDHGLIQSRHFTNEKLSTFFQFVFDFMWFYSLFIRLITCFLHDTQTHNTELITAEINIINDFFFFNFYYWNEWLFLDTFFYLNCIIVKINKEKISLNWNWK